EAPPFRLAKLIVVAGRVDTNGSQPQRECQKICRFIAQTAHRWAPPQIQGRGETVIVPGMAGQKVRGFGDARRAGPPVASPFPFPSTPPRLGDSGIAITSPARSKDSDSAPPWCTKAPGRSCWGRRREVATASRQSRPRSRRLL